MWTLIRLVAAGAVAVVAGPLFFAKAGLADNPAMSLAIRGGIFLAVYIVLSLMTGKK